MAKKGKNIKEQPELEPPEQSPKRIFSAPSIKNRPDAPLQKPRVAWDELKERAVAACPSDVSIMMVYDQRQ